MERYQKQAILKDLQKKMVWIAGPRQAGKTWLAKDIAKHYDRAVYLNYDQTEHQEIIQKQAWLDTNQLVIFDELHKMPNWKNYLRLQQRAVKMASAGRLIPVSTGTNTNVTMIPDRDANAETHSYIGVTT